MILRVINGLLLQHGEFVREDLWVQDGKVVNPRDLFFATKAQADVVVDAQGNMIAPGFIDVQLNGCFGVDFSSSHSNDIEDGIAKVRRALLKQGVTGFCPTIITSSPERYHDILPKMKKADGGDAGAAVLGVHLEGPFINPDKKGAHPKHLIQPLEAGMASIETTYGPDLSNVAIVTLAPELEHAPRVIQDLRKRGIVVSLGHTHATLEQAERGMLMGASSITHLFNAMTAFHHRDPGIIGLLPYGGEGRYRFFYGLIVDGLHTHDASMRLAYANHPEGCVLITDATQAMGLPPGEHHLGDMAVVLDHNHRLTLKGTDTLAGSAVSMDVCVRRFSTFAGAARAVEAASLRPAQLLNIEERKGHLHYGADADFVILSHDLHVLCTYIGGKLQWAASATFPPTRTTSK
ncbi:amidohydrolase domain-containing protein 2 [Salpingoeca rosetta]|uniref:N-acetylglucosamine-6-phosphate deacetylase n=1 Tax=Salpingoeca rosetta (strain ATCC 50818 / BSB-021) TaxID=946362 RepID=F2U8A1_SALR5|nr:amidohydrolase domain-containing protein 2 [Salpingoeca rosetta]EGD72609.1 amidohydrolase domain-containing protein 2 [Salpingoeca rosetta]|eukprot:XP_004994432.1 amidohydrolase domain-containing protein 2 [Salpingoeca rosetta]